MKYDDVDNVDQHIRLESLKLAHSTCVETKTVTNIEGMLSLANVYIDFVYDKKEEENKTEPLKKLNEVTDGAL